MNYLKFSFSVSDENEGETLIALLDDYPFEGFETSANFVDAYIGENVWDENWLVDINTLLPNNHFEISKIPHTNWNAEWESSFEPVVIGKFAAVRAHFHAPVSNVAHEIVITPKMSFGTGHHATTAMVIAAMEQIDFSNKKVLDFGTGTGVLAILAEKLGASAVLAIDNDEWSIDNTLENIANNHCHKIQCQLANEVDTIVQYDVILANINLNVIKASLPALSAASVKGATLMFSGFLTADEAEMKRILPEHGFAWQATTRQGEWICIKANKM